MKRKPLLFMAILFVFVTSMAVIAACKPTETENEYHAGNEAGEYYCEVGNAEYTLTLTEDCSITLNMSGETLTGSYVPNGGVLTITFGEQSYSASYADDVITMTYNDIALRFLRKVNYTVTFDTEGGSAVAALSVLNGKKATEPQQGPTLENKVFVGWYTDKEHKNLYNFNRPVTSNLTLYARYVDAVEGEEYTVTFVSGEGATQIAQKQTVGGVLYAAPAPEKEGAEFVGWWVSHYGDADKLTYKYNEQKLYGDTTFYAVWKSDAPVVSVEQDSITWSAPGTVNNYTVVITGPDGSELFHQSFDKTSLTKSEFDFSEQASGNYIVSVSLGTNTTNAYFLNKALVKPSALRVSESTFLFNPVDNATSYTLSMTCGTIGHSHTAIDLGDKTSYDFSACDMPEGGFTFTVTAQKEGWISATSETFTFNRTLDEVTDLAVDSAENATWSAVEHATSYYVTILLGGEEVWKGYVYDESFSLGNFGAGNYTLIVLPVARGWASPAEAELDYEKVRISTPSGLKLINDTLSWEPVKGADKYKVFVGDQEFETEGTTFDLASHLVDGVSEYTVGASEYIVSVSACGNTAATESLPCEVVKVHKVEAKDFPETLKYSAGVLSWEPALGVEQYVVTIGGETYNVMGQTLNAKFTAAGDTEITLVAKFANGTESSSQSINVHVYKLAFDAQFGGPVGTVYLAKGDPVPEAVTERYGYTFAGWYDDPTGAAKGGIKFGDALYSDDNDLTLYANWVANKYKVSLYEGSQGEEVDDPQVEFESQYTLPVPVAKTEEVAFAGWYSQPNGAGTQYTDKDGVAFRPWTDEERSLYAYWVELFTFSEVEGGYAVSKGIGISFVEEITIPQTHLGKPVVAISDFSSTATLKTVNFYDTINTITVGSVGIAFENCNNLEKINVLKADGNHIRRFFSVDGLLLTNNDITGGVEIYYYPAKYPLVDNTFYVPDVVTRLTAGWLPQDSTALSTVNPWTIHKIVVPASVTYVGADAFFGNTVVREITFLDPADGSEGQELVFENGAFHKVNSVQTINLPARLAASFSGSVFDFTEESSYGLSRLATLTVPENAKHFVMIEGLVCRKTENNGRELVLYPLPYKQPSPSTSALKTSEIIIPEGVTSIPSDAIPKGVKMSTPINNVTKIEIARTVTNIAAGAFDVKAEPYNNANGFQNVTELIFHSTAEDPDLTIGERAFYRVYNANLKISVGTADGELSTEDMNIFVLPENLVNLGSYAFGSYHTDFKTAVVNCGSNGRTLNFAANAFASDEDGTTHTSNITTVKLGQYVHGVSIAGVFGSKVATVEVDENNTYIHTSEEGILFNSEMTEILFYPAGVKTLEVPDTVAKIGDNLFGGRTTLESVILPATLTYIGSGAFSDCTKLNTVTFREELQAGSAEKGLEKADSLTIGDSAFYNCKELTAIKLPDCTVSIGASSFASSSAGKLKDVTLNEGLRTIGSNAFENTAITTIQLPSSLEKLEASAGKSGTMKPQVNFDAMQVFLKCLSLTEIKVAEGNEHYTAIDGVLYGLEDGVATSLIFCPCAKAGTVEIPKTVKVICSYAFGSTSVSPSNVTELKFADEVDELVLEPDSFGYAKITSLTLPSGTTEIGRYALGSTSTLTSVFIPNTVTKIGFKAFDGCTKLETVTFEEGDAELTIEGGYDTTTIWASLRSGYNLFASAAPITKLELPDRIKHIDDFVFSGLLQLESVTIPAGVETIGIGAFAGCTALTELNFPTDSTLREVDYRAFYDLTSLTSLKLPASLRTIGDQAFTYNLKGGNLTSLTLNDGLETIGVAAFMGLRVSELHIPASVKRIEGSAFGYGSAIGSLSAWQPLINLTTINFAENSQIEYIGKSAFASNPGSTYESNLTQLATVNFGNPVGPFEIGENVFENCIALKSITLPAGLKTIAASAFLSCTGLTTVNFAEGKTMLESIGTSAFQNTAITEINFPESENGIELGQTLFNKNTEPVTFNLSASVKSINNSFAGCTIKTITVDKNNPYFSVGEAPILYDADGSIIMVFGTIEGALTIDLGAFEIGANAFANQTGITSVYIPASVVTIHKRAFEGCTSITTVTIQSSSALESIASNAFAGCTNLASINLEATSHLTHLGASAFKNCPNLTTVDLSRNGNLQVLGTNSGISSESGVAAGLLFQNDTKLETVKLPKSITTLGASSFESTGIKSFDLSEMTGLRSIGGTLDIKWDSAAVNTFKNCTSLTSVKLPASVGAIGASAFAGCSALESINLDNVSVFGKQAFSGCGLTSLTLPVIEVKGYSSGSTSYTSMGESVFENNTKLTQLTIPEGVNALYKNAFSGCTSLETLTFPESFRMSDVVTSSSAYSGYSGMFQKCTSLREVTFQAAELDAIPSSMFSGCSKLATVNLNDVHAIKSSAFSGTALTEFTIGANADTVDASVFANIKTLKTLTIKSANVSIGKYAFQNSGLTKVNFPEDTSGITFGDYVFDGCQFESFTVPNAAKIGTYFLSNNASLANVDFADDFALTELPGHFFDGCTSLSAVTLPQSVTSLGAYALANTGLVTYQVSANITTVGEHAFFNCTQLTTVTFAANDKIAKIGNYAFACDKAHENASKLTSVTLPESVTELGTYCFQYSGLTSIKLPSKLATIGMYAFANCTKLASVDFNGNTTLKGIGSHAFEYCTALTEITLPDSLEYTGQYTFQYSGLTRIDLSKYTNMKYLGSASATTAPTSTSGHLFYMCENLKTVKLPANLTHIATECFDGCAKLEEINFPASIIYIGAKAFDGCVKVLGEDKWTDGVLYLGTIAYMADNAKIKAAGGTVTMPENVTSIPANTFKGMTNLKNIVFSESLTYIGESAFSGCSNLESADMPAGVNYIGKYAFQKCTSLKSVDLSKTSMKYIGEGAADTSKAPTATSNYGYTFDGCTKLAEVKLPSTATHIASYVFQNCSSLKSIDLPDSVILIGNYAFKSSGLEHFEFPKALATLGSNVLNGCASLKMVYLPSTIKVDHTTSAFASTVFTGCKNFTIYTDGKEADIKTNWTALKSQTIKGETSLDQYKALLSASSGVEGV